MKILVTGGAGFIGSAMLWKLNEAGYEDIIVVDRLDNTDRWKNLVGKKFKDYYDADDFIDLLHNNSFDKFDSAIHMGACSSTTLTDSYYYMKNNYEYTRALSEFFLADETPFIYASSAATYGEGSQGFSDNDEDTMKLKPLNMYGYSKHLYDLWVIKNKLQDRVTGLKFFNVYGPNEYHKEDMRSLICKKYVPVREDRKIELFKSHDPMYDDGGQMRDFVYIKDVLDVMMFFVEHPDRTGIYNVGTGKSETWNDLASGLFKALGVPLNIEYIDIPEGLKRKYQYFTQANIEKLRSIGYDKDFLTLEEGIADYANYLSDDAHL